MTALGRLLLAFALLLAPSLAAAQESNDDDVIEETLLVVPFPTAPAFDIEDELQFWLKQKNRAPYSGVLLNPEAVTLILSAHHSQRDRGEAALKKQRRLDFAVLRLQTGELRVELKAEKSKSAIRKSAAADDKKRLLAINEDLRDSQSDFWGDFLKVSGGVAIGGVVVAVLLLFAGGR